MYHVQTEDTGENSIIISLLYFKGAILASKKTSYAHLGNAVDSKTQVRQLMKDQHKSLIKELLNGKITGEAAASESIIDKREIEEVKKSRSLDDILIDYIIKQAGNK